ncbi:MAG TPA: carboxymuconolactone decarboxylase family protein [Streptosporangiaceae bacterium]|jgi:alkylhydroperoxidase family enzyme|nr:carboxymuconolactone decarboxylase family protein [Streptosporangiaceae bacterium]
MPYVQLPDRPRGLLRRYAWWYSRRRFAAAVDPVRAASRHNGVLLAMGAVEMVAGRGWRRLDPRLRWLAIQAASGMVGCSWCIDFGYFEGVQGGIGPEKVRAVPRWREASVYDEQERCVLEFAEAASLTPAEVSRELAGRLHEVFSEEQIVELAGWVAYENFRSRFNAGLGLTSQGFAARCALDAPGAAAP